LKRKNTQGKKKKYASSFPSLKPLNLVSFADVVLEMVALFIAKQDILFHASHVLKEKEALASTQTTKPNDCAQLSQLLIRAQLYICSYITLKICAAWVLFVFTRIKAKKCTSLCRFLYNVIYLLREQ
jgi:hypothetical protein